MESFHQNQKEGEGIKRVVQLLLTCSLVLSLCGCVCAKETDYTTGTPWLYIDLEGNVTADTPADLKDDFALWANKDRILRMEIPKGYTAACNTTDVTIKGIEDIKTLFQGEPPEDHDSRLAYDYFYLIGDWDTRDAIGVAPLKEMVDVVEGITSLDALTEYFVKTPAKDRLFSLWKDSVVQDKDHPGTQIISIKNGECLINDPGEYRKMTEEGKAQIEAYKDFFGRMLAKFGYSEEETKQKFDHCFAWETLTNADLASLEERWSPAYQAGANTHYTHDQLSAATPNIPLLETLEESDGYPVMDQYLIPDPAIIENLNELYTEENLPLIRDYLILHGIYEKAVALDWESYTMAIDCQEMIASGEPVGLSREGFSEIYVYIEMNTLAGWALAKYYVDEHTRPEDKERLSILVDEIINAYYGIIEDAGFISEETRAGAIAKLDAMARNVLYPDSWEDYNYEDADFASKEEGGSFWEAYCTLIRHDHDRQVADAARPFDRNRWMSQPHKGLCSYSPADNSISINAAFAQDPNYRTDMSDEELYAYMGTAIAHEISHAFDANGARYDKDGNLVNWWTDEDHAVFNEKNEKLAAYYNAMHPWEGQDFDGEAMVGEACADMTALKCMLRIAAGKPDFDYDKFFRAYADRFATKETLAMTMDRLADEHPMNYLRVNANLQQFDKFLDFYGITEGDNMYLAPEDRVVIW